MKNRYIKNNHISEAKFREIFCLFGADLTAVQIFELAKVKKKTINRILQLLRARIAEFAEEESCFSSREIEVDESYFGTRRVRRKRGRGASGKTNVFGMKKREDKVYTQIVANCSAAELVLITKKLAPDDSIVYSDEWKEYYGIVNEVYRKHYLIIGMKIFINCCQIGQKNLPSNLLLNLISLEKPAHCVRKSKRFWNQPYSQNFTTLANGFFIAFARILSKCIKVLYTSR
jgi:transposase-like protein